MSIEYVEKKDCVGCSACANICPKSCIKMKSDEITGFQYPNVDAKVCIQCGMCERVCPVITANTPQKNEDDLKIYAAWSKNEEIRFCSTSGGIFSELANFMIQQNGYVAGAKYGKDNLVEHALVSDFEGVKEIRQSKYIQSDCNSIYQQVFRLLKDEKKVLFCGSPCQVAALKNFVGKKFENLITIDFICRGMNSPKAYQWWLDEIETKQGSKAKKVWFKYKIDGWKKSPKVTRIDFQNGSSVIQKENENCFMEGYLGPNLYIRPSCANCRYKGTDRASDITLADFWGVVGKLDDDKGTSLVMVNSKKGKEFFDHIKDNVHYEERELKEILDGNVCFEGSVEINPKSEEFLSRLGQIPFSKLIKKYTGKKNIFIRIIRKIMRRHL